MKFLKLLIWVIFIINLYKISFSNENFYDEGVKLFKSTKYEEAKFLFERNIVIDPKHSNSYLYLAKIYNQIR
jgi:Tfp pilus assembly protein PilF